MATNEFGDELVQSSATTNEFGDEQVQVEKPGFVTSVKRGFEGLKGGVAAMMQQGHSSMYDKLDRLEREGDTPEVRKMAEEDLMFENYYNMWKSSSDPTNVLKPHKERLRGKVAERSQDIERTVQNRELYPASAEKQAFDTAGKEKGFMQGTLPALAKAPVGIPLEVVGESLGGQAPMLPATAAATLAMGPGALVAGAGAGSFLQELGGGTLELLAQSGVDPHDPDAVMRFYNSPEYKAAWAQKVKKAQVVGAMDALGAALVPVPLGKTPLGNIAGQTAVQMTTGGAGEALGAKAAGEAIDPSAVTAEVIGEIPGGATDTATLALSKMFRSRVLGKTAEAKEKEALTGTTASQDDMLADVTGAGHRPKLSPLQSKIVLAAAQKGVDPQAALAIAGVESGLNPTAKNPKSTAYGLFQQLDSNWEENGGGDRTNVDQQIANGLTFLSRVQAGMEKSLGRKPTAGELYAGHMLGEKGGTTLVQAAGLKPEGLFLDTVKSFSPENAQDIVKNNGFVGMTNAQALERINGLVKKKSMAYGGEPEMNAAAKASPDADAVAGEELIPAVAMADPLEEEALLADLDEILARAEETELTPEDIDAALEEETQEKMQTNPLADEMSLLADEPESAPAPDMVLVDQESPRLPVDLAGAKPRFGFGKNLFNVDFVSDIDRAAYIVANPERKSPRDTDYLNFVMEHMGMTEEEARAYGREVRAQVKEAARTGDPVKNPNLVVGDQKRAESFSSMDEAAGRKRYANPNDAFDRTPHKAPIVASSDPSVEGLTLEDAPLQPGQVTAVGVDSPLTPIGYMKAAHAVVQDAIARFAPTARVALTFATEKENGVSSMTEYASGRGMGTRNRASRGRGLYRINLRNATKLGQMDEGSRNTTTPPKIAYATWHEIGHVIAAEHMTRGMNPALRQKFENLERNDYFTEEELATLPVENAAVLREYNELKWKTLNDPGFTAEDFAYSWLSPWKLAHGWGKNQGLLSFAKMFVGQAAAQTLKGPAKPFAESVDAYSDVLSPHEYLAEQMSRYAYTNRLAEHSSFDAFPFFQAALQALRTFFAKLKRGGEVKPGIAFAEWVDSLTTLGKEIPSNKAVPVEVVREARTGKAKNVKPKKADLVVPDKSLADTPPLVPAPLVTEKDIAKEMPPEFSEDQATAFELLDGPLRYLRDRNPSQYRYLTQLVREGRLYDFQVDVETLLADRLGGKVRFDRDVPESAESREWADVYAQMERGLPGDVRSRAKSWLDHGWRAIQYKKFLVMTLRQLAFSYPKLAGLQLADRLMTDHKALKSKLEQKGLDVAQEWKKLGKEQAGLLDQALREEHKNGGHIAELTKVNGVLRFVPNEAFARYAKEKGLDPATATIWLNIKNAHLSHMNALHDTLRVKLKERLAGKPKTLLVRAAELKQVFDSIRARPFLPQTRFGQYALHVVEKGVDGLKVVHVEFFESDRARNEARELLAKAAGKDRKVVNAHYSLTSSILRTLPPEILQTAAVELGLTDREKAELKQIADAVTKNPTLRRYSSQLAEITGSHRDLLQNFSEFMWHSANNITKLRYRSSFHKSVALLAEDMQEANAAGDFAYYTELEHISRFMRKQIDHILSPQDEYHMVRAAVVYKNLWFKISTALMNLTSLVQMWSLAARQQGNVKGSVASVRATLKATENAVAKAQQRILRQKVEGAQVYGADTKWALDQAKSDGLIDETFAAQLATFANAGTLARLGMERGERLIKRVLWLGMMPQHAIETLVREANLVVQFEHYMKKGLTREKAYIEARKDTYLMQGDNSLANRPQFMRGKASLFFIFYGWMQQMMYLMSGAQERARNYREAIAGEKVPDGMSESEARARFFRMNKLGGETVKMWMAFLLLGGLMGVPGAEDLSDVLELVARKLFGARFSLKEYAFDFARNVAEGAAGLGVDVNPRSIVHGAFADFSFFGLTPAIDVSSSLSLGHALPGGGALGDLSNDPQRALYSVMGPFGGTLRQLFQAFDEDATTLKKLEFFLPAVANNALKTYDEHTNGAKLPSGGRITIDRETGEVRDITTGESLFRLMGFQPEILTANKELHWMQREAQGYWISRRGVLMAQAAEARLQGDREAEADVEVAIEAFNEGAPKGMEIRRKDIFSKIKRVRKQTRLDESGRSRQRRFREIDEGLAEDFIVGEED